MNWTINQTVDLSRGYTPVVWPDALMVSGDDQAHTWRVSVLNGGAPANLTGAVATAYFVRDDGATVAVGGTVSGHVVSVTFAQSCYAVAGRLGGVLRVEIGSKTVTLSSVMFTVKRLLTDSLVDPGRVFPTLEEMSRLYDALKAQTEALASGSPKGTYATLTDLQTAKPSGDTGIYVVTADGKWYYWSGSAWAAGGVYQSTAIADGAVTPDKTSFARESHNLLNPETVNAGHYVNAADGVLVADSAFSASDYIPVQAGAQYTMTQCRHIAYYYPSKTYLNGSAPNQTPYTGTAPAGAAFLRFSWLKDRFAQVQLNQGATLLPYEPYGAIYMDSKTDLSKVSIPTGAMAVAKASRNIYDPAGETQDVFLDAAGVLTPLVDWVTSGFVPVVGGETYTLSVVRYLHIYDVAFARISGGQISRTPLNYTVTLPANASYIRVSYYPVLDPVLHINIGPVLAPYEDYGAVIPETSIRKNDRLLPLTDFRISIPPKVYGVVGRELNIYFDGLGIDDYKKYQLDVVCEIGAQQSNRYTVVPSAPGSHPLTIWTYKDGKRLHRAATTLVISAETAGDGTLRSVMAIGDSTTAVGVYTGELQALADADTNINIILRGTQGTAPNLHEGRSGWMAQHYVTDFMGNPFWNPSISAFDFGYYKTTQGLVALDYALIHLGINDIFQAGDDDAMYTSINAGLEALEAMANDIRQHVLKAVGVCTTIPPAYAQDAFGTSYGCGQTLWRYRRNLSYWSDAVVSKFRGREAEKIHLVPLSVCLDTEHNFPSVSEAVNSRNSKQVERQNNGVHPAPSGYHQMADAIYAWIKSVEA